jgi:hypothetical protein
LATTGGWNFDASPAARGRCDLGTVRLARGTRVSGRVVRAPDLLPVAGAELRFERFADGSLGRLVFVHPTGTSAADGSFTLQQRITAPSHELAPIFALSDEGLGIGIIRAGCGRGGRCRRRRVRRASA